MKPRNPVLDWLAYAGVRAFSLIAQMFPIDLNLKTARLLGRLWYAAIPRHRQRAEEHLRASFGHTLSSHDMDHISLRCMQQTAMMAMELLFLPRLINEWTWPRYVRLADLQEVLRVVLQRRGCILVTGHFGNWELLGFMLAALGIDMVALMRPLDNPYLNRHLVETRLRRGLRLLYKKGAMLQADDVLRSGKALCFIADQNAGRKGLFVDFFGRKASTYKSIGLLAAEHGAPIIVGYARRLSERFEYEIGVNRIIHPHEWTDRDDPVLWITQEYTRAIEVLARRWPEQYLWVHRRWKTRPPEEDTRAAPKGIDASAGTGQRGNPDNARPMPPPSPRAIEAPA